MKIKNPFKKVEVPVVTPPQHSDEVISEWIKFKEIIEDARNDLTELQDFLKFNLEQPSNLWMNVHRTAMLYLDLLISKHPNLKQHKYPTYLENSDRNCFLLNPEFRINCLCDSDCHYSIKYTEEDLEHICSNVQIKNRRYKTHIVFSSVFGFLLIKY